MLVKEDGWPDPLALVAALLCLKSSGLKLEPQIHIIEPPKVRSSKRRPVSIQKKKKKEAAEEEGRWGKGEVCRWASPLLAARVRGPVASPRERRVQASRNESAMAAVAHKSLPTSNLPRRGHHWCSSSSFRTLRWDGETVGSVRGKAAHTRFPPATTNGRATHQTRKSDDSSTPFPC